MQQPKIATMENVILNGQALTLAEIEAVALGGCRVEVAAEALVRVAESRGLIERILAAGETVYGVNTGFGKLADVRIPAEKLAELQINLVRSHAGGVGEPLSGGGGAGHAAAARQCAGEGIQRRAGGVAGTADRLAECGRASGDSGEGIGGCERRSGPLAHLALVVVGEGEAFYRGERMAGGEALRRAGLKPLQLSAKEGLALLNGTQAMTAVGALATSRALRVVELCDLSGAMSLEALKGTPAAFDKRIHKARPHAGQIASAAHLMRLMEGSEIRESHREHDSRVQDAYCLALHAAGTWRGAGRAGARGWGAGDGGGFGDGQSAGVSGRGWPSV